jgi:hypothetical protein
VDDRFAIKVTYNGVTKDLEIQADEQMQAVLQRAINLFSLQRQPHQMGLFTEGNIQVAGRLPNGQDIHQSVEHAKLQHGQLLILKQVVVEGGAA